jgi:hypothetical protein
MTAYRCWIEFPNDKPLQLRVQRGELGEPDSCPLQSLPAAPNNTCWPAVLHGWCGERKLGPIDEGLTVRIKVKRAQIEDFIDYAYGGSGFYFNPSKMLTWKGHAYLANRLNDLRACVAQQLSPRLWYELWADEF